MKLKGLTEREIYMIGFAVAKCDDTGTFDSLISEIGNKLSIDAVAGEGYATTVWRACGAALDMPEPEEIPYIGDRICEVLSNVGVEEQAIYDYVMEENFDAAIERSKQINNDDKSVFTGADIADTIGIICKQYEKKVAA